MVGNNDRDVSGLELGGQLREGGGPIATNPLLTKEVIENDFMDSDVVS